jgi:DNA-directed RNA polymerase subunit RPC12/RpoP
MNIVKILYYIAAAIVIFFGILFIWGAFSPEGSSGWIFIGLITVGIGFGLIWLGSRKKSLESDQEQNVTYNIDLPSTTNLDSLKCTSCGGTLTADNIKLVAGAPVVNCPYCHSTYQLKEEPKW